METKPLELSPIKRIMPVSKVFVSVVIRSNEYMSSTEIITKIINKMLNTRPRKSSAYEQSYMTVRSEFDMVTG